MTAATVAAAMKRQSVASTNDVSAFRKGDAVVYPAHGLGRVDRVGYEEIAGHRLNLVHISFEDSQMTLRVPATQASTAGLRKLASPETLSAALAKLKGRQRTSRLMWAKRSQEYVAKINTGDPEALAEVIRDLQSAADGAQSSMSQRRLFELALDRLAGELAAVRDLAKPEAIELINRLLADARAEGTGARQQADASG